MTRSPRHPRQILDATGRVAVHTGHAGRARSPRPRPYWSDLTRMYNLAGDRLLDEVGNRILFCADTASTKPGDRRLAQSDFTPGDPCGCQPPTACYVKPKHCGTNSESPVWVVECPEASGDIVFRIAGSNACYYINKDTFTTYSEIPPGYELKTFTTYVGSCAACNAEHPIDCPRAYLMAPSGLTDCGCLVRPGFTSSRFSSLATSLVIPYFGGFTSGTCEYRGTAYYFQDYTGTICATPNGALQSAGATIQVSSSGATVSIPGWFAGIGGFPGIGSRDVFTLNNVTSCASGNYIDSPSITFYAIW